MKSFKLIIFILIFSFSYVDAQFYEHNLNNITLHSASELDYPPFSVVLENKKAGGFSVDLLEASINAVGGNVDFYVDDWNKIKKDLKDGKLDVLPVVGRTNEREKDYDFTIPYLSMHGAVFTREDYSLIQSSKDIKDKTLLVMKGDNAEEYLRANNIGKEIIALASYEEAFKALSSSDKYDAVIVQKMVGVQLIKELKLENIKSSDFLLSDFRQDFSFAVKDGNKELLSLLNEGLSIVISDGTYDRLYKKWFADIDINLSSYEQIINYFYFLISFFIFMLMLSYLWNKSLKKNVLIKTKELDELNKTLEDKVTDAVNILKQKDEILIKQSRHAAMGEMIGMIAHQWRQPLATISMDANNMLLDSAMGELSSSVSQEYANSISEQTQHLSQTIDDFRNFFKPDKEIAPVNIRDVIEQTLPIVKDSFKNNNIKLTSTFETDKEVAAYPRELMQVFVNIITNAKDALVSQKTENPSITIRVYEDDKYINSEISDNAGGIDVDILEKVFDPYFSTKDEKNGTGIGLYMSKMIIENHLHGVIEATNKDDGACFSVKLLKEAVDAK